MAFLLDVERALHATGRVTTGRAGIDLWRTHKEFYATTGSRIAQTIYQTGSVMEALAVGNGERKSAVFRAISGYIKRVAGKS